MKRWIALWLCLSLLVPSIAFATQAVIVVPDGTGAAVRAGFNSAIMAAATNFEGPTAPSITYPGQFWADTGTGTMWQRNQGNTAWVRIGVLDSQYLGLLPISAVSTTPSAGIVPMADSTGKLPFSITGNAATASNATLLQGLTPAQIAGMATAHGTQYFLASGTFTVPAGCTQVVVTLVGGGGAGGAGATANGSPLGGGGGSAGAYYLMVPVGGLTPGAQIAVTVGAGGLANGNYGLVAGNGGSSSFGGYVSVVGGNGGNGGYCNYAGRGMGAGGPAVGGLSGAGLAGAGANGGAGGSIPLFYSVGGATAGGAANPGAGYGSGGSGGGGWGWAGANGAPGLVIVQW